MPRYTFTPEDRCRGGKATAAKYDMKERGRSGLQALANKYFQGNVKKAGDALSRVGRMVTDPFPENRAWSNHRFFELPPEFLRAVWGHVEARFDDESPF